MQAGLLLLALLAAPSASASGGPPRMPAVLTREAWEAAPSKEPFEPMLPLRITIHHTAMAQAMTYDDARAEMRLIQANQQGEWIDIGYHFVIDGAGRIWEGRPHTVIGSHVEVNNQGNLGIVLMGHFDAGGGDRPTPAQLKSLLELTTHLVAAYGIPADAQHLNGHRDQRDGTLCPGARLYGSLEALRRQVAQDVANVPRPQGGSNMLQKAGERILRMLTPAGRP